MVMKNNQDLPFLLPPTKNPPPLPFSCLRWAVWVVLDKEHQVRRRCLDGRINNEFQKRGNRDISNWLYVHTGLQKNLKYCWRLDQLGKLVFQGCRQLLGAHPSRPLPHRDACKSLLKTGNTFLDGWVKALRSSQTWRYLKVTL